ERRLDRGACSRAALDQSQCLQFAVCLDDGIRSDGQLTGELAHRRQRVTGAQNADFEGAPYLLDELHIDGHATARIDVHPDRHGALLSASMSQNYDTSWPGPCQELFLWFTAARWYACFDERSERLEGRAMDGVGRAVDGRAGTTYVAL